jgi:hypothetical protein
MARDFKVEKRSDEFGQYTLIMKCGSCLRERRTTPNMIAHICGWDATTRGRRATDAVLHLRREELLSAGRAGHGA